MNVRGNANIVLYRISSSGNSPIKWVRPGDINEDTYTKVSLTFKSHRPELRALYVYTEYRRTPYTEWFEIENNSLKLERGTRVTR